MSWPKKGTLSLGLPVSTPNSTISLLWKGGYLPVKWQGDSGSPGVVTRPAARGKGLFVQVGECEISNALNITLECQVEYANQEQRKNVLVFHSFNYHDM